MRGNNLIGIIFSNIGEESLGGLTQFRTMGSVPIAGKYKMIDFPLSNMSNSGINRVGVIVKNNYKTLMDHLGSGKPWNLSRINDGLFVLPPHINGSGLPTNRIDMLSSIRDFIIESKENYVLLCDCNLVCNINYTAALKSHIEKKADITIMYYQENKSLENVSESTILCLNENYRVKNVLIDTPCNKDSKNLYISSDMMIFNKSLLVEIINKCKSHGYTNFKRDVIQRNIHKLKIYGYEINSFVHKISSLLEYFNCNMSLIDENIKNNLFNNQTPVYTKTYNNIPAKYTENCKVTNSLVSNGCIIDGKVKNSILFEGVHVGKNSCISNSIIMGNTNIGYNCHLSYTIVDENTVINMGKKFMGFKSYPVYISKSKII